MLTSQVIEGKFNSGLQTQMSSSNGNPIGQDSILTSMTLLRGSDEVSLIELSSVTKTSVVFMEGFALTLKVTLVQVAFSLVLSVCTVDNEISDVVNLNTAFVKPYLLPTVTSDILTLVPGIADILMFAIEQFWAFD